MPQYEKSQMELPAQLLTYLESQPCMPFSYIGQNPLPVPVSIVSSPQGAEKGGFIHQRHFLPVVEGGTSVPDRAP
jgi:hypothetical protein